MYIKLDQSIEDNLACPICKSELLKSVNAKNCLYCSSTYPNININSGKEIETTIDFRIMRPAFCAPPSQKLWEEGQIEYENLQDEFGKIADNKMYQDEIDSVYDIYTEQYRLSGNILDVGGHQGRLRHFVPQNSTYVSIDPFVDAFQYISKQKNLLLAYPALNEPCNFLIGRAENLPFKNEIFDWVHMRSVVDHFEDPYIAFKEAYRVLKPGGKILIGLAIMEKLGYTEHQSKISKGLTLFKNEGILGVSKVIFSKLKKLITKGSFAGDDHHLYHFSENHLKELVETTGFHIIKEYWAKPPFEYCIYLCGEKPLK